ncbi:MAG: CBS domain-containing protein [Candidatus Omnitrophota bacterium]|nr:MAG: CBS domain-containing protein [Candidatus Omnitrophota bacterium]
MKKEYFNTKDFFGISLSSPEWLIKETSFGLDEQHTQESIFTLGNGFIGSRGVLEEYPERAMPGTFITGIYDKSGAQVEELVNLPNPIHFIFAVEGEKLDMHFMGFLKHVRYLDMHKGLLVRKTLFKDGKNRKFLYQSLRFFNMKNPHIGWMKVSLTLLNGKAEVTALDFLDDSATNYGGLVYGTRRHMRLMDADTKNEINYYAYRTITSKIWVAYADRLFVEKNSNQMLLHDRAHNFELQKGETITFTKVFTINTSLQHHVGELKEKSLRLLKETSSRGLQESLKEHVEEWKRRWEQANVTIKGDKLSDKALRLNIYHLIIAAYKGNFPMSIGARALSGQGYRGHIFWDSEIFMLPFYLYTDPPMAKNMLLYRYKRLSQAIANAKKRNYKGALFPWQSASIGDEVTLRYAKDTDGTIMKVETMDYEHHISADIAYAVFNYYRATDDFDFIIHHGAEIVFSTARFWASCVTFNEKMKKYEILDVIGPDEFHTRVKNDFYTNILASWNMEYARSLYYEIKEKYPDAFYRLEHNLRLHEREVDGWRDIAKDIYIPKPKEGIIEQFKGYFKKKQISIRSYSDFFMPEAPQHLSYKDFDKTQFIKQADVLFLFYLLPQRFDWEQKIKNYQYYIKRTLHQSSLSPSIHALLASEFGDCLRAYLFFLFSSQIDLKNLHNNSDGGMHMANAGGIWQAAIFGFAGISFEDNKLTINPRLPAHWKLMQFKIFRGKSLLRLALNNKEVEVTYYPNQAKNANIQIGIFEKNYSIEPFKTIKVKIGRKEAVMVSAKRLKDIIREENLIFVNENDPIKRVSHVLKEKNASSVPVVKANNQLCGIISKKDIVGVTEREDLAQLKAKDIMNKSVEYVNLSDHVEIALRLFTERSFQLLPVVKGKTLVGCITRKEILSVCSGENY